MKKLNQLTGLLLDELGLFLSISIGIFLFVLFFQPFQFENFDFNNKLIFVSGLPAIVFLFMFLVRVVFPWVFQKNKEEEDDKSNSSQLGGLIILVLSSVAFAFYLRFVGQVTISFFVMIKVVIICSVVPITLSLYDSFMDLKRKNESLIAEKRMVQKQVERYEEDYLNKTVDFFSDNNSEQITLLIADVVFIKSADNYVEIVYKETDSLRKKLIRNTLKNIEHQIKPYSNFIRCHRICIVNLHFVEKLESNYGNHWLLIKGYNEQIPVSRQYLLKLKEVI